MAGTKCCSRSCISFLRDRPIEIAKLSVEVADRQFGEERTSIRRLLYEKANRPARDLFDPVCPKA
jgi:hypothetical protein